MKLSGSKNFTPAKPSTAFSRTPGLSFSGSAKTRCRSHWFFRDKASGSAQVPFPCLKCESVDQFTKCRNGKETKLIFWGDWKTRPEKTTWKNVFRLMYSQQHWRKANVGQSQPYLLALPRRTYFAAFNLQIFASSWTKLITKTVSIPTHLSCLADNLNLYANLIFGGFRILQRWHLQASWTKARYNDHRQTLACHDATKEELSLGSSTSRERFQIVHFNPLSKFQTF